MSVRFRHLIVGLIAVVLLGGGALVATRAFRQQARDRLTQEIVEVLPNVAQRIRDFHRVKVENGRKVWEVAATEAQYLSDEEVVVVTAPVISFYAADGREVALRGREGKVFLGGRDLQRVELNGDIQVRFGDYALRTDAAHYERVDESIVAPGRVDLTGRALDLSGEGLELHLPSQRLRLRDNVHMVLRPQSKAIDDGPA